MRNKLFTVWIILAVSLLVAVQLQAFDGNREGFVLGFAGGLGYTAYEHKVEKLVIPAITRKITATYPYQDSGTGLATDFVLVKLGATPKLLLTRSFGDFPSHWNNEKREYGQIS